MQTIYTLLFICLVGICKTAQTPSNNLLLIVLLDGFRYDYIEKYANPDGFLMNMSKTGIYAMYEPIFPTNTYPNYWTIVTGLYPESNGIINNDVYDPISKHQYRMGYDDENQDDWFRQAEPVWIQNERVNGKAYDKHSVVYDWAGAPAQFDNIRPYAHRGVSYAYENLNTSNATVDAFVSAIEPTKTNLALIALAEPDTVGHYHGPNSVVLANTIKELDYVLLRLLNKLHVEKGYDIKNDIDLIILSDHGMTVQNNRSHETFDRTHVYLEDYFDNVDQYFLNSSTFSTLSELWLRDPSDLQYVYDRLMTIKSEYDYKVQDVYLKANLPERFHVKNNNRTAPIIIVAKPGYLVLKNRNSQGTIEEVICMGTHGYDLELSKDMYGMFAAKGKSFRKSGLLDKPLRNIDTYELICHLLHISPNSNNGTFERVRHLLNRSKNQMQLSIFILFGSFFTVLFIN